MSKNMPRTEKEMQTNRGKLCQHLVQLAKGNNSKMLLSNSSECILKNKTKDNRKRNATAAFSQETVWKNNLMRLWGLFTNIVLDSLDKGEAQYSIRAFTIDVRTKNLSQSKNLPDRLLIYDIISH
ncbi:hypothetical protein RIR_jg36212.t1 [Rhizophagus irregularis DAOM 181602=DAOM 197198]|nr:hypothetical protein RIR_jg36212.t1 [Rhizophagus irregularis DAOM 181602=DAOM 197198]CAG8518843.1 15084_t:CDS:2 [Rhizophagus irregularis]